jgi:hypothetical protein
MPRAHLRANPLRSPPDERIIRVRMQIGRATPKLRHVVERLIAHESRGKESYETSTLAAIQVGEKLRAHLATLMGVTGSRALVARALALATAEAPCLRSVSVGTDGDLEGLEPLEARVAPQDIATGLVLLLAQLLGLLVAFIGEDLALRLVHDIWPTLSIDDLSVSKRK